jgi:hypothetical protein
MLDGSFGEWVMIVSLILLVAIRAGLYDEED